MTKKQLRFVNEYFCDVLWRTGNGWEEGENFDEINSEIFNFSENLRQEILEYRKIYENYWNIMEKIPGGGWSRHTKGEFETARIALGLPEQPDDEACKIIENRLIVRIKEELPEEYELIEMKPVKFTYGFSAFFRELFGIR